MFYYVQPSSVFLKPSFILYKAQVLLKPGLESSVIQPFVWGGKGHFLYNHGAFAAGKLQFGKYNISKNFV